MREDITLLSHEIQSTNAQVFALVDRLLTPHASGPIVTSADVMILMQVCALMPKVTRALNFLQSTR
jgi:hypothetical protein